MPSSSRIIFVNVLLERDASLVRKRGRRGLTPLHLASQFGHTDVMESLLKNGADPNAASTRGFTPLHSACSWQQPAAVQTLLTYHARPQDHDYYGSTPLHLAASSGRVDIAKILLEHVEDDQARQELIMFCDGKAATPLHEAAGAGHAKVVQVLLEQSHAPGVTTMTKDAKMRVPLHLAVKGGHLSVVEELLTQGVDQLGETDDSSSTPLHLAVAGKHVQLFHFLCMKHREMEKSPDVFDSHEKTPLHLACEVGRIRYIWGLLICRAAVEIAGPNGETPLHIACRQGFWDIAELLIEYSANPSARNGDGCSPLHLASSNGHLDIVNGLVMVAEDSVNMADKSGRCPIHAAAQGGHYQVFKALQSAGADLKAQDERQTTLLHFACQGGSVKVVQDLLDLPDTPGGTVDDKNTLGQTPLHTAAESGHLGVVKELLSRSSSPAIEDKEDRTPLEVASSGQVIELLWESTVKALSSERRAELVHKSAREGHQEVLTRLLDMTKTPNMTDKDEKTPLIYAAIHGRTAIVTQLLGLDGIEPDLQDASGRTALSHAAGEGHLEVVRELTARKCDINGLDKAGRTPLSYAAENGHMQVIDHLLDSTADINRAGDKTPTAIWYATRGGEIKAVERLLGRSADPNVLNENGETLLHLTAAKDHWWLAERILAHDRFVKKNAKDISGSAPIYTAIINGHAKTAGVLLANSVDKEIQGPGGHRPLHAAIKSLPLTRLLISAGVEIDAANRDGSTALSLAISSGHEEVAEELLKANANPLVKDTNGNTALHIAAISGARTRFFDRLLAKADECDGFNINAGNHKGRSLLWDAVRSGNVEVAQILLARRDIEICQLDNDKHSPLWAGITSPNPRALEVLLGRMTDELWHSLPQAGERLESLLVEASKMYDTALFGMVWSSLKGHIDSNEDGVFKLAMSGRLEVARFLLDHGADPSRADRHGWTLGWLLFANQDRQGQDAALTPGDLPAASFLAPTSWSEERKTRGISISVPSDPNGQALQTKLVADSSGRQGTRFSSGLKRFWRPVRFRSFRQQEGIHADHPAPPKGIFYFEVTILDQKPDSNISVGFCTVDSDLERMAGWEEQSSGYHSSDGSIHHGSKVPLSDAPRYGKGDIVGCGLDTDGRYIFFTFNGRLEYRLHGVLGRLYPTVRMSGSARIQANFGGGRTQFKYNVNAEDIGEGD